MHLISRLESWPKSVSVAAGSAMIVVVGVLDYLTGYRLSFSAVYLLPILFLAWLGGAGAGYGGAVACTVARTITDTLTGQTYESLLFPIWNAGMRLVLYVVVALLIGTVKSHVAHERSLAREDPLTGAANTRAFLEMAQAEIERSRRYGHPLTLAYVDLDNFKSINDTRGHSAGDEVLRGVSAIVRASLRSSDILARLGGDEFAILLPEANEAAARAALEKVQARFSQEAAARGWPIGLSIGAETAAGGSSIDLDDLLSRADRKMYAAKERKKRMA